MNIFQVILVSIVEGITEFLPISSTGHQILVEHFLHIPSTEFVKSFDIIIQFGAIMAVIWLYWSKIISSKKMWLKTLIAFLPTGFLGFTLYKLIKDFLLGNVLVTVISLFLGGIVLLMIDKVFRNKSATTKTNDLSNRQLIGIGLYQSISMIPGVSRSAATIVGGMLTGLSKKEAVEFSFLLAIPTMAAASGYDLLKSGFMFSGQEIFYLSLGFVISFISAMIAVKSFTSYISHHDFRYFAFYRIILALVVLITFVRI